MLARGLVRGRIKWEHTHNRGRFAVDITWHKGRGGETFSATRTGVLPADMRRIRPNMSDDWVHRFTHELGLRDEGHAAVEYWREWMTQARTWHYEQMTKRLQDGEAKPTNVWRLPSGDQRGRPPRAGATPAGE